MYQRDRTQAMITTGNEYIKKSKKLNPATEPIMIFGGSQTSVPTPAIFERIA